MIFHNISNHSFIIKFIKLYSETFITLYFEDLSRFSSLIIQEVDFCINLIVTRYYQSLHVLRNKKLRPGKNYFSGLNSSQPISITFTLTRGFASWELRPLAPFYESWSRFIIISWIFIFILYMDLYVLLSFICYYLLSGFKLVCSF